MKFSYNWLKELVSFKESPEQLAEFLTMRAFEVESVDKVGNDWALNVSGKTVGPRMSDASGHLGMAKEIAALKNLGVKSPKFKVQSSKSNFRAKASLQVQIDAPGDCLRYTARIMTDIQVAPSPKWLQERLGVCGLQSINNIVDATNYVMLELGQPLHAFDWDKLNAERQKTKVIVVRRAKKGETIETLDGNTYKLTPEILLITDGNNPLAIAGIKGGQASGITVGTHAIVLESANFASSVIHTASQLLRLKTDASYRFEHGMDPNQTAAAVNRLAQIIQELGGGTIAGGILDVYPKKAAAQKILFSVSDANRLLGTEPGSSFYQKAFARIGCVVTRKNPDQLLVAPLTIRRDLAIQEDLVEEAGRMLGYENIPPKLPEVAAAPVERNDERYWEHRTRDFAIGSGFSEALLYAFSSESELAQFFIDPVSAPELEHPLSPETKYLVPRVLIKFVASAVENLRNFDTVKIFGMGKSFVRAPKGVDEHKDLIFALAARGSAGEREFYEMKGVLDQMFESFGIRDQWYDDTPSRQPPTAGRRLYHPYRIAEIKIGNASIGVIGEIHPEVLEHLKSRGRVIGVEIDFGKLWQYARDEVEFRPIGKYPAVARDIAIIVPEEIKTDEVANIIESAGGPLLVDTDLFDYFQDEEMRLAGRKNLAFHLVFQSPGRTLKDTEVEKLMHVISDALEARDWDVRR